MQNVQLITRELINEMLTPEEEREWMTHIAQLPKHEIEEAREHMVAARVITQALVRLMNDGAAPECEAVQKLVIQSNQLTVRYHLRERLLARGNWNEDVAKKVNALGVRLVMKTAASDGSIPEAMVLEFCYRARKVSSWGKALDAIVAEAIALGERNAGARSVATQSLAERLVDVCEEASLGDPVLYGRWYVEFGGTPTGDCGAWAPVDEQHRKAWALLIEAVETSRHPAGLRAAAAW
jgi:hypothetical protein